MLRWFCSRGYVLVFAAAEGETALEPKHEHLRNGYFTGALLEQLAAIGHCRPLSQVVEAVLARVHEVSLGRQRPAVYRTAKEDVTLVELLGYRPLPSAGTQASLRDVVLPLCDVFARQVCFMRGRCKVKCSLLSCMFFPVSAPLCCLGHAPVWVTHLVTRSTDLLCP